MFIAISWLFSGLLIGMLARLIFPCNQGYGLLPTIGIGLIGSTIGGVIGLILPVPSFMLALTGAYLLIYILEKT